MTYTVIPTKSTGMSKALEVPSEWSVVGPWNHAPYLTAFWPCSTKEEAERLAGKMTEGRFPENDF